MNKDLNWLKAQIKGQSNKRFEADKDRVFDDLIQEKITFTSYQEIADFFKKDKEFVVDSVIAASYGMSKYLVNKSDTYIFRIRYIN